MITAGTYLLYFLLILAIFELLEVVDNKKVGTMAIYTGILSYSAVFLGIALNPYIENTGVRVAVVLIMVTLLKYFCDGMREVGIAASEITSKKTEEHLKRAAKAKRDRELFEQWRKDHENIENNTENVGCDTEMNSG